MELKLKYYANFDALKYKLIHYYANFDDLKHNLIHLMTALVIIVSQWHTMVPRFEASMRIRDCKLPQSSLFSVNNLSVTRIYLLKIVEAERELHRWRHVKTCYFKRSFVSLTIYCFNNPNDYSIHEIQFVKIYTYMSSLGGDMHRVGHSWSVGPGFTSCGLPRCGHIPVVA